MENLDFNSMNTGVRDDSVVATLMRNVYLWMTLALVITGLTALFTAQSEVLLSLIFLNTWTWIGLIVTELVLVLVLAAAINKMSFSVATLMFILYSIVNGLTLSVIFLVYEMPSIATTFFVTAGMFGAMAIFGTVTKKDLSGIGKFALMALIGLIIAGVVNMFLQNSPFDLVISAIGVVIFAGLTAYDSQKIRQMLVNAYDVDDTTQKIALYGSLRLYLDFVNLFLYLLRFFGNRK